MDSFLWGLLKERVYAVPPRTTKYLVAKLQIAVTTVDEKMLRSGRENSV
jgi:hypothetical protein